MVLELFLMCHYIILHVLLHVLLCSLFLLKRMRSLTFFIPISHVRYIYGHMCLTFIFKVNL